MASSRYDRAVLFFGEEGQRVIRESRVAVVGVGGLGTHVTQQLALLGVGGLILVEPEELDPSNLGRYIGAHHEDPIPGMLKIDLGARLASSINPDVAIERVPHPLISTEAFAALRSATHIFGCVDNDGARLVLTELSSAYEIPYLDLATEIFPESPIQYGGRVCISWGKSGCLVCRDELDMTGAQQDLMAPEARKNLDAIYGVPVAATRGGTPSVVTINGAVASLGASEFLYAIAGIREPRPLLTYRGTGGTVIAAVDDPTPDCFYCSRVRGSREAANLERYLG